jgi:signal peptidase II
VIDFIDIGFGAMRWPTFNLADVAVTGGAALLAWALWGEDDAPAPAPTTPATAGAVATAAPTTTPPTVGGAPGLPGGTVGPA